MMADAVQRILKAERSAALGGVTSVRTKIITTLAASFSRKVRDGELWELLMYVVNGICPPSSKLWLYLLLWQVHCRVTSVMNTSTILGQCSGYCTSFGFIVWHIILYCAWPVLWILSILWICCMTHYIIPCLTSALDTVHLLDLLYDILFIACWAIFVLYVNCSTNTILQWCWISCWKM